MDIRHKALTLPPAPRRFMMVRIDVALPAQNTITSTQLISAVIWMLTAPCWVRPVLIAPINQSR